MRITKQLQPASGNPDSSLAPLSAATPWTHSRIKSAKSNFQWQRNLYRRNVSHSLAVSLAPSQLRAAQRSAKNFSRSLLARTRLVDLHGSGSAWGMQL